MRLFQSPPCSISAQASRSEGFSSNRRTGRRATRPARPGHDPAVLRLWSPRLDADQDERPRGIAGRRHGAARGGEQRVIVVHAVIARQHHDRGAFVPEQDVDERMEKRSPGAATLRLDEHVLARQVPQLGLPPHAMPLRDDGQDVRGVGDAARAPQRRAQERVIAAEAAELLRAVDPLAVDGRAQQPRALAAGEQHGP
jgi:hypothetical protein